MAIIKAKHDNSSSQLAEENHRLKLLLTDVIQKVEQNECILSKFQRLEINLLQTSELAELLNKLTIDFIEELELDAVKIELFDPDNTIFELLYSVQSEPQLDNLILCKQSIDMEQRFQFGLKPQLRQNNSVLSSQLFGDNISIRSFAILPLVRHGILIGSYHLGSQKDTRFGPEMSTDFLNHFAMIVSLCLENTINTERLKLLSLIDPLTKMKNRRCFYIWLNREIARSEREKLPLSCLFIDVDHFKRINDGFGHLVGDQALKHLALLIESKLRPTDCLSRFGGEEFTVLLPNTDAATAKMIAQRIRNLIANTPLQTDKDQSVSMTCSIGGTTWEPNKQVALKSELSEALIKSADRAVYHAKSNGRNQTVWFPLSIS